MIVVTWVKFIVREPRATLSSDFVLRVTKAFGHPNRTRGMDSHTNRKAEEQRRQAEIRQRIALLQAQLTDPSDSVAIPQPPRSPKRKAPESTTLAPATPSPSKLAAGDLNSTHVILMHLCVEKKRKTRATVQVLPLPRANRRPPSRRTTRLDPSLSHEDSQMSRRDLRSLRGLHHSTSLLRSPLSLRSLAITDINVMSVLFWWKTYTWSISAQESSRRSEL
jgi:hypothetical protein